MNKIMDVRRQLTKGMYLRKYHNPRAKKTLGWMSQSPGAPLVNGHIFKSLREQGFYLDVEADNKSVYDENQLWAALGRYAERVQFCPDEDDLQNAVNAAMRVFGCDGTKLSRLEGAEELSRALKLEKASGAPCFTTKKDAFEGDYQRMLRVAAGSKAPEPCVAARRIQHGDNGPKTRLVWSFPLSMTMLEAKFARPLIAYFLRVQTPMAFGLHRFHLAGRLVKITNSSTRLGLDFSGFDSSIVPKLIASAFAILKTHFDLDEDGLREWKIVESYFIHTPILMPDGNIYRKHKGVPSGSYFTQMVDSIVNYIALRYLALRLDFSFSDDNVLVLGDDSVVGVSKAFSLSVVSKVLKEELGLTVNAEKSEITHYGDEYAFLGHAWVKGLVTRDPVETAKRLAFPERPKAKDLDPREYIAARMVASLVDSTQAWPLYRGWNRARDNILMRCFTPVQLDVYDTFGWERLLDASDDDPNSKFGTGNTSRHYGGILV